MAQYIGNIKVKGLKKNKPKLVSEDTILPFYQTEKTLNSVDEKNKFIKAVEKLVRTNITYKAYKSHLMIEKGLNFCQIHPNVISTEDNRLPLEMHHGPILTLYDICTIITDALLNNGYEKITTFQVAKIVLEEHRLNNVQVVMLCENCHDLFHAGGYIYINPKQCWGDLDTFLKKWDSGISSNMRRDINESLRISRNYESSDNGMLDARSGKSWKNVLKDKL